MPTINMEMTANRLRTLSWVNKKSFTKFSKYSFFLSERKDQALISRRTPWDNSERECMYVQVKSVIDASAEEVKGQVWGIFNVMPTKYNKSQWEKLDINNLAVSSQELNQMSYRMAQAMLNAKGVITDDEVSFSVILDRIGSLIQTNQEKWIDCARARFIILNKPDFDRVIDFTRKGVPEKFTREDEWTGSLCSKLAAIL